MKNRCGMLGVLLLALCVVNAWAGCYATNTSFLTGRGSCSVGRGLASSCNGTLAFDIGCSAQCATVYAYGDGTSYCVATGVSQVDCNYWGTNNGYAFIGHFVRCDNNCEADSIKCVQEGGAWLDDPSATECQKSCRYSACVSTDTAWLNTSISDCNAIRGENNYAIKDSNDACLHSGICCSPDSTLSIDKCDWKCQSLADQCSSGGGLFQGAVLTDTISSGGETTYDDVCYYNCSSSFNGDSTVATSKGNIALVGPDEPVSDGTKTPNDFNSIRTASGGSGGGGSGSGSVYTYDFLSPSATEYVDSLTAVKCANHLWRCVKSGKYTYWYDNQAVPEGCTNIVRIK